MKLNEINIQLQKLEKLRQNEPIKLTRIKLNNRKTFKCI